MVTTYIGIIEKVQTAKQSDPNLLKKEILIRAEILKRDFTKRQMNIIGAIFLFSYAYGKEWALIPKMKDFELAGISSIKIRSEIDQLVDMGVVKWNQEENLFRITNPSEWTTKYHSGYSEIRSKELIALNLQHFGFNLKEEL
jgi:hypothetical protein